MLRPLVLSFFSAAVAEFVLVGWVGQGAPTGFGKYPGYTGPLVIDGRILIKADGLLHNFSVNLTGAEPNGNVSIHIHSGVTCETAASVGGHLWSPFAATDPWLPIKLPVNANGNVVGAFNLTFGYDKVSFIRHALVVHNTVGARVACAQIHNEIPSAITQAPITTTLSTYPGYQGTLTIRGEVTVWDVGAELAVNYRLTGLNPNATGGLHIHVGMDCANSGAHFWWPTTSPDPWANATLTGWHSNENGTAEGTFHVPAGVNQANASFRTVVAHEADANKTRAACGVLSGAPNVPGGDQGGALSTAPLFALLALLLCVF